MTIAAVITGGFGSFGSINLLITDGYDIGSAIVIPPTPTPTPEPTPGGGLPRNWRSHTGRSISRAELDRAVHALRALRTSAAGLKKRKNREIAAEVAAKVSQAIGIIEDYEIAPPALATLTATLETAASARKPSAVMAELGLIEQQVSGMLQWLALLQDDEDAAAALLTVI